MLIICDMKSHAARITRWARGLLLYARAMGVGVIWFGNGHREKEREWEGKRQRDKMGRQFDLWDRHFLEDRTLMEAHMCLMDLAKIKSTNNKWVARTAFSLQAQHMSLSFAGYGAFAGHQAAVVLCLTPELISFRLLKLSSLALTLLSFQFINITAYYIFYFIFFWFCLRRHKSKRL